ncbi:PREDICTED: uncharacterized protein LOC109172886 [Ipomoea nil]|uniref:uncharacterized protein LOC109172886 n=1 Tax=Ipomoea nil TaxID=35883 RepID=UPI0009012936|nr:PREDICTED: uncharacterized protein LOC109172886 [Ipomoea nil]
MSETIEHIFCECIWARRLWGEDDVLQGRCMQSLMESVLSRSNRERAFKLAAIIWTIWIARNEIIWRQASLSIESLRGQVERLRIMWKDAFITDRQRVVVQACVSRWILPPHSTLKCNVDAALFEDGVGSGAVVRDHDGHVVAVRSGKIVCDRDPFMAEVVAAKETLVWLTGLQRCRIILESDCLNFCNAFNSRLVDYSYVGLVIKQCVLLARDIGTSKSNMSREQRTEWLMNLPGQLVLRLSQSQENSEPSGS